MQHATAIPSRTYPFSSDQGSQTGLGSTSTRLSDRPGTLSAVVSFVFMPACCIYTVCSAQKTDCLPKCERCPTHTPRLPCCIFTLARNNNQLLAKVRRCLSCTGTYTQCTPSWTHSKLQGACSHLPTAATSLCNNRCCCRKRTEKTTLLSVIKEKLMVTLSFPLDQMLLHVPRMAACGAVMSRQSKHDICSPL